MVGIGFLRTGGNDLDLELLPTLQGQVEAGDRVGLVAAGVLRQPRLVAVDRSLHLGKVVLRLAEDNPDRVATLAADISVDVAGDAVKRPILDRVMVRQRIDSEIASITGVKRVAARSSDEDIMPGAPVGIDDVIARAAIYIGISGAVLQADRVVTRTSGAAFVAAASVQL